MKLARWLPASLATRFALAAAGLAAAALMLTSLASWWLINEQNDRALKELARHERQFRAAAVGAGESPLRALAAYFPEAGFGLHMGPWPSERTRAALAALGVVCPRVDEPLVKAYLKALTR